MTIVELPGDTLRRYIGSQRDLTVAKVASDVYWGTDTVYNLQSVSVQLPPSSWRVIEFPFDRFIELAHAYPIRLGPNTQFHADFHLAFLRQRYYKGFGVQALEPDYVPPPLTKPSRDEMQGELARAGMAMGIISPESSEGGHTEIQELKHYLDQMEHLYGLIEFTIAQLRSALPPIMPDSADTRAGTADDQRSMAALLARHIALSVLAAQDRTQDS